MTETEKMYAYIFASQIHPNAVPLLDLKKGDAFRWPHSTNVLTYNGKGWYKSQNNKSGRASTKTAVIKVN